MNKFKLHQWENIILDINKYEITRITDIHLRTNITLSHVSIVLSMLKEQKIVTTKKIGRHVNIEITDKGRIIAKALQTIKIEMRL